MPLDVLDSAAWLAALDRNGMRVMPSLSGYPRGRVRMAKDWDTGFRHLDEHLVYACRGGWIVAHLGEVRHRMVPGDICLVPPRVRFRFRAETQPVLARFRFRAVATGRDQAWGDHARIVPMDATTERLVDLLIDELHAVGGSRLTEDLARCFCRAFARAEPRPAPRSMGRARLTGDQLAILAAEIARHPCSATPADLARRLGLSLDWASRLIRVSTGLAPRTWIIRQRLHLATDLLAGGLPPTAVSQRLGYRDPRLFGRQFRKHLGAPPGIWQRQMRRE